MPTLNHHGTTPYASGFQNSPASAQKTGQPDFAEMTIEYVANQLCLELKALKIYIWSYRDEGAFHEAVTNRILQDLVTAIKPRFMRLTADFNVRGGIYTTVVAEHRANNWQPQAAVTLP